MVCQWYGQVKLKTGLPAEKSLAGKKRTGLISKFSSKWRDGLIPVHF